MIPGWIISLITFPGVIVHEIAHRFFADLAKVPVYKVCYFRLGNPAGYVIHGTGHNLKSSFLISVGPLIVNTLLCAIIGFSVAPQIFTLDVDNPGWVFSFLLWISVSIGMHAFPSGQDMHNFVSDVKKTNQNGLLFFAAKFFSGLMLIANALRVIWFDAIYAVMIIMLLPRLLGF